MRNADVVKHPTLAQWAYLDDATVTAQGIAKPLGATVQTLDATWFPIAVTALAEVG